MKFLNHKSIFLSQKYNLNSSIRCYSFQCFQISNLHSCFTTQNISCLSHQFGRLDFCLGIQYFRFYIKIIVYLLIFFILQLQLVYFVVIDSKQYPLSIYWWFISPIHVLVGLRIYQVRGLLNLFFIADLEECIVHK